ncbi:hypothetical protein PF007_g19063 [Phytophthora fragariae]|uniref:Uncharacterized protein n=1 Tax=Phytophthora fragariae TaxID=53985 RepID=A0A6A3RCN4_9STRA|nr:hypothetical protein PF003_g286 [Phytophthora fragariae]KAE9090925.1 hypothetical protein PF007_g19063 [Phytophthora fragariae]KAE9204215.1 hypothetical protein PF004_g17911 [Phytophthora fragariae]
MTSIHIQLDVFPQFSSHNRWSSKIILVSSKVRPFHQPLHTVTGTSAAFPEGDGGGSLCLRAPSAIRTVWDAAGGLYSLNKWSLDIDDFKPRATPELIALLQNISDNLNFTQYETVTFEEFCTVMFTHSAGILYADSVVNSGLDLNATSSGVYPCPSDSYMSMTGVISQECIAIGGSRLAVILKHFVAHEYLASSTNLLNA